MTENEIPAVVQAWIGQLLDHRTLEMVRLSANDTVDIRLSAARGRVRSKPIIVIGGGPGDMVEPG